MRHIIIRLRLLTKAVLLVAVCTFLLACDRGPSPAAPRQLNAEETRGRSVYNQQCLVCHEAHSTTERNGPSLAGFYQKKFMASGQPVNDERVRDIITLGRSKMPAFGDRLSDQQVAEVIAYLKTL